MSKRLVQLLLGLIVFLQIDECAAFHPIGRPQSRPEHPRQHQPHRPSSLLHAAEGNKPDDDMEVVFVQDDKDLPEGLLEEVAEGQPPTMQVVSDILGLNIFSVILMAAIAFFFSMNAMLGPGWLGSYLFGGSPGVKSANIDDPVGVVVDLSEYSD